MNKDLIKEILIEQHAKIIASENGIERNLLNELDQKLKIPHVLIISGIRRSGKSTLMRQIISRYYNELPWYYINFDDERWLGFHAQDFNQIYECLIELYGQAKTFFIDEIQNVDKFESFVRRFYDDGFKFIITGSNSNLLGSELASRLTGRYIEISLYPFDFREFLKYNGLEITDNSIYKTDERALLTKYFEIYLHHGGMPEYIKYNDNDILRHIYDNIVSKDIALRYSISKVYEMRELFQYLITNFARRYSYTSVSKNINLESKITVKDFISYFEFSFLGKQVYKFDFSFKKQLVNEKKLYIVDNAFIPLISTSTTKDKGRLLENLVFNILKKKNTVHYFNAKKECDFICTLDNKINGIFQVCFELNDTNIKREVSGLLSAMEYLNYHEGLILTYDQDEEIEKSGYKLKALPVWKWLLNEL
ncbi:MAG: ATP-binding protein [Bacteroidales bacterium]